MLSSKAKYAIRAMLVLSEEHGAPSWTSSFDIAERAAVPQKFLEAILLQLRERGLLASRRGAAGGHRLLVSPAELSVADVIRIIDGPIALTPCASRTRYAVCKDCVDVRTCRLRLLMQRVRDATAATLEGCSIADLAQAPALRDSVARLAAPEDTAQATGHSAGRRQGQNHS